MRSILFRTLEPMMFRGASEFSPASRGPQTGAWSRPLPPPSTIAGTLATLILLCENRPPPRGDTQAWYEEVIDILGGKGSILLKGPYLMNSQGDIYVQYYDGLLPFEKLMEGLTKGKLLEATKGLNKLAKEYKVAHVNFVGIRLLDRRKAIETGLIYSAAMVDYSKIGMQKNTNCGIMVEVLKASNSLELCLKTPRIMRLGGEGRLVQVMFSELQPIGKFIKYFRSSKMRLYVATPILFEASPHLLKVVYENGALTSDLTERVEAYLNGADIKVDTCKVMGNLGVSGGFSAARPIRKPIYASLQAGSVIEVSRNSPFTQEEFSRVYSEGLGLFRDLGYGTVIPIPVTDQA